MLKCKELQMKSIRNILLCILIFCMCILFYVSKINYFHQIFIFENYHLRLNVMINKMDFTGQSFRCLKSNALNYCCFLRIFCDIIVVINSISRLHNIFLNDFTLIKFFICLIFCLGYHFCNCLSSYLRIQKLHFLFKNTILSIFLNVLRISVIESHYIKLIND